VKKITSIPHPGGSGLTPTGALQFQDDWPGLFIRGDDAMRILGAIRQIQEYVDERDAYEIAAPLTALTEIAGIIERDVIVRRSQ
jgi:hypothetical protein